MTHSKAVPLLVAEMIPLPAAKTALPKLGGYRYPVFARDMHLDWKKLQAAEQFADFVQTDSKVWYYCCLYRHTLLQKRRVKTMSIISKNCGTSYQYGQYR